MSFQIHALRKEEFEPLFGMTDEELKSYRAVRSIVTKKPGYPCRASLADAEIGEEVLLVHYVHHDVNGPFRASHAVYIRPGAPQASVRPGEVPEMIRLRTLSLRGFDKGGMMVNAELAEGSQLEDAIGVMFQNPDVETIHLHFAKPGCFAARVTR